MRIIAGKHRSRKLSEFEGNQTRPTLDHVKEAVFSRIGPYFDGDIMLDLFSGSGNIGLEFISRGCAEVYCVDKFRQAVQTIRKNVELLKEEKHVHILHMDYEQALRELSKKSIQFDYIYIDPPYFELNQQKIVQQIVTHDLLKEDGCIIVESDAKDTLDEVEGLLIEKSAVYRKTKVTYLYKK